MKKIMLILFLFAGSGFAIELGKIPTPITLNGESGAKIDNTPWSSSMLKGKMHILFYVDPDKKDLNSALADALRAKNFDRNKINSVAIINLAATWMPDALIESKLKAKQKQFPNTMYVKDKKKVLVKKWNLADENSDVLLFDKQGSLIYKKFGKTSQKEIREIISLIEKNLK